MNRIPGNRTRNLLICCGLMLFCYAAATAQTEKLFLGIRLRPEVQAIADEVERKTNRKIYAEFTEFEAGEFLLGASFISEKGTPILRVNNEYRNQPQKIESIAAHELLHLRLRASGFPVFLFSPTVRTKRGLAQDVEQSNVNDLASLIEHQIFKTEMERLGLNKMIDLAGDAEKGAKGRKGTADGQADALNFARAILEYQTPADVQNLRKIYAANNWHRSLKIGQEIADIIRRSQINSSTDSAAVFRLCAAKLYPSPRPLKLTPDKSVTAYKQLLISY